MVLYSVNVNGIQLEELKVKFCERPKPRVRSGSWIQLEELKVESNKTFAVKIFDWENSIRRIESNSFNNVFCPANRLKEFN